MLNTITKYVHEIVSTIFLKSYSGDNSMAVVAGEIGVGEAVVGEAVVLT